MHFYQKTCNTKDDCHYIDNLEEFALPFENPILKNCFKFRKYDMKEFLIGVNKMV